MAFHFQEPADFEQPKDDPFEPADLFSMLRLNNGHSSPSSSPGVAAGGCGHLLHHSPCAACGCQGFNSMKRRSPESDLESSPAKKPSCEQENQTHPRRYTAIPLPLSPETLAAVHNTRSTSPVFRRCVSDPYTPPSAVGVGAPATPNPSPENTPSASCLPPRPPSLKRCVSDPTSFPAKTISLDPSLGDNPKMGKDLVMEENSNSNLMRLRRMKNRLREMKNWWDEIMQDKEEEEEQHVDEGDRALSISKDDCAGEDGAEEVVSVEWVEKSLCINFKCPCGKGYQILLSGNKCYYKLV